MGNEHGEWVMRGLAENDSGRLRTAQELADFTELFKFADELNTATMDCWFD